MARKRSRRSGSLNSAPEAQEPIAPMDDYVPPTYKQQYDNPIGPSYFVPKEQYQLLKKHILGTRKRKTTTTKKKPAAKKLRRRYPYRRYYGGGRTLSGMGPIVITGRGGYFTDKLKQGASAAYRALQRGIPEGTFERLGTAAGGAMFGKPGKSVGSWLGQGVSNVLGFGDYAISKNDLLQLNEGVPVPTFADLNQGIVVCHREYLGDIVQSVNFTINRYSINPGDNKTFPWLSTIAPCFDQYELLGCLFQFRSTASDFGTTTNMAMGTVIMTTEYDSADADYASKIEMENAQYTMSGKPSNDMIHPIECDPTLVGPQGIKYVRTGPVPSGKDIRLYDHGTFFLATSGMPASTGVIGELWVTYKIAFYKPQLPIGNNIKTDIYNGTISIPTNSWPQVANANNSLNSKVSGNDLIFPDTLPVNSYLLVKIWIQGGSTTISAGTATVTNCTAVPLGGNFPGSGSISEFSWIIKITAASAKLTYALSNGPSAPVTSYLIVTQIDSEVGSSYL